MVHDVERATKFYVEKLGFEVVERWGPAISIIHKDGMTVWLSGPPSSAAKPMPDGRVPEPGGWNRLVVEVKDLPAAVERLKRAGATFRNQIITGPGGSQILLEDGEGNVVALFEPRG